MVDNVIIGTREKGCDWWNFQALVPVQGHGYEILMWSDDVVIVGVILWGIYNMDCAGEFTIYTVLGNLLLVLLRLLPCTFTKRINAGLIDS